MMRRQLLRRFYSSISTPPKPRLATTPVFYVNANPHIGHAYTSVLADALVRASNDELRLSTGTDEHGIKVFKAAQALAEDDNTGMDPMWTVSRFTDRISDEFKALGDVLDLSQPHAFVRTTDATHQAKVKEVWDSIKHCVSKGTYEGWYCVSEERYVDQADVTPSPWHRYQTMLKRAPHSEVVWTAEKNYMFKLFPNEETFLKVRRWIETSVFPKARRGELLNLIDDARETELAVSRPTDRCAWGIRVPGDDEQTVYVWIDALSSYLTANDEMGCEWPPKVQVIGKDIGKFHAIYWPCLLLAMGMDLPDRLVVHGHFTISGMKMSKSLKNTVCPFDVHAMLTRAWDDDPVRAADGLRWFLLKRGNPSRDGAFPTFEHQYNVIIREVEADLANNVGNLVSRAVSLVKKNNLFDSAKLKAMEGSSISTDWEEIDFSKRIRIILERSDELNVEFAEKKPWEMDDPREMLLEVMFQLGKLSEDMRPMVPHAAARMLRRLTEPECEESVFSRSSGRIQPPRIVEE